MVSWTLPRVFGAFRRRASRRTDEHVAFRWPLRQIRWQIILPYAFLVVVLAAAATYMATSLVHGSLNERFENQLVQASRVASDSIVRQEESHLQVARSVAFTQGLPDAIESGDGATVSNIAESIAANSRSERLEVLNSAGQRMYGVQLTDPDRLVYTPTSDSLDNPNGWPLVDLTLQDETGAKYAQLVDTSAGVMMLTSSPIFNGDAIVGVVLVGTSMQTLVDQMKVESLADLTIYDFNSNALVSTFVMDSEQARLDTDANTLSSASVGGSLARESRTVWGRTYDFVYGDLVVRDRKVGYYSVALSSDFIFSADSTARWQMAAFFGIGMALVLAVGFLLARAFTNRIQQLVTTAERVTAGDLTARNRTTSDDELGRLAACFNRMTDRLEGQYMATMRALASAVAGRNPYTVRHSFRVGQLATLLGRELGADERALARLEIGGYLHDIGKIGVRHSAAMRAEVISPANKRLINEHPHIGLQAPESATVREPVLEFIGAGADGDAQIDHIVSRIATVADMYDALTADRPDAQPIAPEEAMEILRSAAAVGKLHLGAVEALARILPQWERSQGRGSDYAAVKTGAGR